MKTKQAEIKKMLIELKWTEAEILFAGHGKQFRNKSNKTSQYKLSSKKD